MLRPPRVAAGNHSTAQKPPGGAGRANTAQAAPSRGSKQSTAFLRQSLGAGHNLTLLHLLLLSCSSLCSSPAPISSAVLPSSAAPASSDALQTLPGKPSSVWGSWTRGIGPDTPDPALLSEHAQQHVLLIQKPVGILSKLGCAGLKTSVT